MPSKSLVLFMTIIDVEVLWKSKCLCPQSKNAAGRSHLLHDQQKLNPEAFVDLYQFHNKNFDSDPDAELYTVNGFLVLAADGDVNGAFIMSKLLYADCIV